MEVVDDTTILFSCEYAELLNSARAVMADASSRVNENFISARFLNGVRLRSVILQNINMQKITYENSDPTYPYFW